jgi:hypothetical protein
MHRRILLLQLTQSLAIRVSNRMPGISIKNRRVGIGKAGVVIPAGTSAERPEVPVFGSLRYNTTGGYMEVFNGTSFVALAIEGLTSVAVDTFTGDGSTVVFGSMTNNVDNATDILVFIGGVYQTPTTNYTVNGTADITFTAAPPNSVSINIIHNLNSTAV